MMNKLLYLNLKYKYISLIVVVLFSVLGIITAPSLPINLSLKDLLPKNNKNVIDMNIVSKNVGGGGHLMMVIGPINNPQKFLPTLKSILIKNENIKYIFYEKEKYILKDKALYLLSKNEFKQLRKNARTLFRDGDTGLMDFGLNNDRSIKENNIKEAKKYFSKFKGKHKDERYYLSNDKKYALLLIKAFFESVDLKRSSQLAEFVKKESKIILKNVQFRLVGRYIEKVRDTKQIKRDIGITSIISAIFVTILLILGLGSYRVAFVTIATVILSLGWTIGLAYYVVGQINIITGFLLAILSGLGADYGIHLIRRYYQEKSDKLSHEECLKRAYLKTGQALFSAAITTAIAFFCLNVSDFRGFSELGTIAGFGVLSIYLVFMLTFPSLAMILPKNLRYQRITIFFQYYPFNKSTLKYSLLIIPFIIYGIFYASFEYDFNRMRDLSVETRDLNNFTEQLYGRATSPAAILAPNKKIVHELENWFNNNNFKDKISDVISLQTVVPLKMTSRCRKIKKLKKMLRNVTDIEIFNKTGMNANKIRTWIQAKPYTEKILPPQLRNAFGKEGNIILVYPEKDLDTRENLNSFVSVLKEAKQKFPKIKIGSDSLVFVEILDHIFNDGIYILIIFIVGVFVTFYIDFKNLKSAIIMGIQLILGILTLIGLMGLFGIRFTIMNVGMFPAILAAGIDMAVHVRHRELDGHSPFESASLSAGAINVSLLTTLAGFGSIYLAEAKLLLDIAWIAVLGLLGMYFITMIFWPSFKHLYFLRKSNKIISSHITEESQ